MSYIFDLPYKNNKTENKIMFPFLTWLFLNTNEKTALQLQKITDIHFGRRQINEINCFSVETN